MEADERQDEDADVDTSRESVPPADQTDKVAAISFDDTEPDAADDSDDAIDAEDEADDLDEQPTQRMGALSAEDAAKVAEAAGQKDRRSMRVFKRPSSPPKLELQLQTAQFQAQGETRSQRPKIAAVVLIIAFALGGIVAWALHQPVVRTTPLTPRPTAAAPTAAAPTAETPAPAPAAMNESAMAPAAETEEPPNATEEVSGAERAEELLEEAESARGPALRALLEEAAAADPSNPHAAAGLAEFFMESDPPRALEWAQQAAQLRRRRAAYRDLVADAYEQMGNLRDAAAARAAAEALRTGD